MSAKFFAENAVPLGACSMGFILGVALIAAGLNTEARSRQQTQKQIEANKLDLWQAAQLVSTGQDKAVQRYQMGCYVVDVQLSRELRFPDLEPNDFVCDKSGRTGVIAPDGTVYDIVRTTDEAVITARLSKL